jgi:DNA-binding MarR family transcriptional regulator
MTVAGRTELERIDHALLGLRRFVQAPDVLHDDGSTKVELSTLLVLDAVGDDGASVGEVAARLRVAHSTASRLVVRAEEAEAVQRVPSAADARAILVVATDGGRQLRRRALEFRLARLAELTDGWTAQEVETFTDLLGRFSDAAGGATG